MDTKDKEIFAKDIYTGKLDARYEELTAFQEYNMNFPSNIDIDSLIKGDKYYITGNKGTGKTALLLYLSNIITKNDQDAVCSTILFKTDYNATERIKIQTLERKIIDTLDISSAQLYDVQDFSNIWMLTIFLKIVLDNKKIITKYLLMTLIGMLLKILYFVYRILLKLAIRINWLCWIQFQQKLSIAVNGIDI